MTSDGGSGCSRPAGKQGRVPPLGKELEGSPGEGEAGKIGLHSLVWRRK